VPVKGLITSMDDYYQMNNGLVVMETTNSVINSDLFNLIVPQSLFSGQRVRVANMMANSGEEWFHAVRKYNSGSFSVLLPSVGIVITRVCWSAAWLIR